MPRAISLILMQFLMLYSIGQDGNDFHPPLKIPLYLSGNFGEIRSDHFHSGIDIKTQGRTGLPVFSIDEGYISRIKVQANGYGNSIYINHPGGLTSVYGHLDRYRDDIAAYVKRMQYKNQSFTVDLYPGKESFPLKKGELIAYSGNTGGSSGPHLHFEIRSSGNQHPGNVLRYNFEIKDRIAPRFHSVYLLPLDNGSHVNGQTAKFKSRLVKDNGIYTLPYGSKLSGAGNLGISVEVFDYLDEAANRCGIYTLAMYVNNELVYSHVMDEFAFSETRYVNANIDYQELVRSGIKAHRLYRLPNDRLRIYDKSLDNKALVVENTGSYRIRIIAADPAGNSSELAFTLQGDPGNPPPLANPTPVIHMKYDRANSYEEGPLRLDIPARALYQDMDFGIQISPRGKSTLGPFYLVGNEEVPVHLPYTLSIQSPPVDPGLRSKLLIVSRNKKGEIKSAGGAYQEGAVVAKLRNFGTFSVALDTLAPEIIPRGSHGSDYSSKKELRFTIRDDLSGIGKYEGYIDNHWALFEYDPKNELLFYRFDEKRIARENVHELELYVSDQKGNTQLFHTTFEW